MLLPHCAGGQWFHVQVLCCELEVLIDVLIRFVLHSAQVTLGLFTSMQRVVQAVRNSNVRKQCGSCGVGQILLLLLIAGLMILAWTHPNHPAANHVKKVRKNIEGKIGTEALSQLWNKRKPPKVKSPGVQLNNDSSINVSNFFEIGCLSF